MRARIQLDRINFAFTSCLHFSLIFKRGKHFMTQFYYEICVHLASTSECRYVCARCAHVAAMPVAATAEAVACGGDGNKARMCFAPRASITAPDPPPPPPSPLLPMPGLLGQRGGLSQWQHNTIS